MRALVLLVAILFAVAASAEEVTAPHQCKLSPDRKQVTVLVSNPFAQTTFCQVNCHLPTGPGGMASVSCGKEVEGGAKDFVLCERSRDNGAQYIKMESSNAYCIRQDAAKKDDKEDDDDDDEMIKKMMKQGQDILKGMKK